MMNLFKGDTVKKVTKLVKERQKVAEELHEAQKQLSMIDSVVKQEMEKSKKLIEEERTAFRKEKKKDFDKIKGELNEIKAEYLNKLIEYNKLEKEFGKEYLETFGKIERKLGLYSINPNDYFRMPFVLGNVSNSHYKPLIHNDEQIVALRDGKLDQSFINHKDDFKG